MCKFTKFAWKVLYIVFFFVLCVNLLFIKRFYRLKPVYFFVIETHKLSGESHEYLIEISVNSNSSESPKSPNNTDSLDSPHQHYYLN